MRIKRNEEIGNIPIIKIRDYFKCLRRVGISKENLREHFGLSLKNVNFLIKELLQNDFIEKTNKEEQKKTFQLTIKGQALCSARCISPIHRHRRDAISRVSTIGYDYLQACMYFVTICCQGTIGSNGRKKCIIRKKI